MNELVLTAGQAEAVPLLEAVEESIPPPTSRVNG